jgi:hemerythrin-like domain-containing protein
MPVQIGAKPEANFNEPFGLLRDCHRRVEMFLNALVRVADQAQGHSLTSEQAQALERALRYFREAAPKHTADEEESLFPRLRQHNDVDSVALIARAESLERDHRSASLHHDTADHLGRIWLEKNKLEATQFRSFQAAVTALAEMYKQHIAVEDNEVFPVAEKLLNRQEKLEIGREMEQRRRASRPL